MAAPVSMKLLLEAGVHFGHQTRRWDPRMRSFIFTERNGIHIIDLQQTVRKLDEAMTFARDLADGGGSVMFVGTKKQAQETIQEEANRADMPFVNQRWLGGMLTNYQTIQQRIRRLEDLERRKESGEFDVLPKKEATRLNDELSRLGHDERLARADNYFLFTGGAADDWLDRTVGVRNISGKTLKEWIAPGKPLDARQAAISSLARLQKDDKQITQLIASNLTEPHAPLRFSAIFALGERGDATAIPALESLLNSNDLSIEMAPMIKGQIARLKQGSGKKPDAGEVKEGNQGGEGDQAVPERLERLEKMLQEMSERLKSIEERLPPKK